MKRKRNSSSTNEHRIRNTKKQKLKKDSRARNWFLTWNNHDDDSVGILQNLAGITKYCIQEEIGEEGTPHLQGVLCFKDAKKFSTLKNVHKGIHWEMAKNLQACKNYCLKEVTSTGKRWVKGFAVHRKIKDPLDGKTPYAWQASVLEMLKKEPDDRSIVWIWDDKGNTGKSALVKSYILKHMDTTMSVCGGIKDITYAIKPIHRVVFWDIPRSQIQYLSYQSMEKLKDGVVFAGKYESTMKILPNMHIICFANSPPDEDNLSADRWKIYQIVNKKLQ